MSTARDSARLSRPARAALKEAGVTVAEYSARAWIDGTWHGDACGCYDDRCIGFHHEADEECGCLPVLIRELIDTRATWAADRAASAAGTRLTDTVKAFTAARMRGDLIAAVTAARQITSQAEELEARALDLAREHGTTWRQIADALGYTSPQAAQQRHRALMRTTSARPTD